LRKAGFMVTAALSVQDALDKLELHAPDLIISETTFPDGDGFELRRRVRATPEWGEIPFIFLTAEAAIENKIRGLELGVDDYLTKPIYIKEIVTRINILLQKRQRVRFEERRDGRTRFAGRVQDMPVVDVIQTIEISRKSGVIQFVGERGRQAAIYFRDGRVIDAEAGSLQGEDAVYRLLTWGEGEFEVVFRTVRRREIITMSSQALLMEGMRRLDEWSRLFEQLPPLTHRFEIDTVELAARLGDVPDDNNRILRLVDGKRTLLEVIDASDVGDLECLQAISRLYFEELLIDLDHGLDHNRVPRRDTGKSVALVEVDGPSPIHDEVSGPISVESPAGVPSAAAETEPAAARAEDTVEAMATGGGAAPGAAADDAAAAEDGDESSPTEEAGEDIEDSEGEDGEDGEAEAEEEPVGPLMGGYRPSSLRLIDEAVAAAQAIEPSLFDGSAEMEASTEHHASNGVARAPLAAEAEGGEAGPATGAAFPAGAGTTGNGVGLAGLEAAAGAMRPEREDSGLRMIGSLGRDRAEASGELAPLGHSRPIRSETARELVTILPRRITRELPILAPELADSLPTPTPTSPVLVHRPAPAIEPEPTLRVARPGSGVRAPSRSQRLLRIVRSVQGSGPGIGALLLILLALVLAGTAVLLRLRRHTPSPSSVEPVHNALGVTSTAPDTAGATSSSRASPDVSSELRGAQPDTSGPTSGERGAAGGTSGARDTARTPSTGSSGASAGAANGGHDASAAAATNGGAGASSGAAANGGGGASSQPSANGSSGRGAAAADAGGPRSGTVPVRNGAERTSSRASPGTTATSAVAGGGASSQPSTNGSSGAGDAGGSRPGTAGRRDGADRASEAKLLCDQASNAMEEGDFTRAFELTVASLKLRKTARAYILRARAEQRLNRVDAALASLDLATEIAPTAGAVWEQRGRILWAARRRDEARAAFGRFLELDPKSPRAAEVLRLLNEPR
jgi:DNA-binding response OmpR family regulator